MWIVNLQGDQEWQKWYINVQEGTIFKPKDQSEKFAFKNTTGMNTNRLKFSFTYYFF